MHEECYCYMLGATLLLNLACISSTGGLDCTLYVWCICNGNTVGLTAQHVTSRIQPLPEGCYVYLCTSQTNL